MQGIAAGKHKAAVLPCRIAIDCQGGDVFHPADEALPGSSKEGGHIGAEPGRRDVTGHIVAGNYIVAAVIRRSPVGAAIGGIQGGQFRALVGIVAFADQVGAPQPGLKRAAADDHIAHHCQRPGDVHVPACQKAYREGIVGNDRLSLPSESHGHAPVAGDGTCRRNGSLRVDDILQIAQNQAIVARANAKGLALHLLPSQVLIGNTGVTRHMHPLLSAPSYAEKNRLCARKGLNEGSGFGMIWGALWNAFPIFAR